MSAQSQFAFHQEEKRVLNNGFQGVLENSPNCLSHGRRVGKKGRYEAPFALGWLHHQHLCLKRLSVINALPEEVGQSTDADTEGVMG